MIIDCGTCAVRGDACTDCVVTFLTRAEPVAGPPGQTWARSSPTADERWVAAAPADLDEAERRAIDVLAGSGLVPPLRLEPVRGRNRRAV